MVISGTNFVNGNSVKIGGVQVEVVNFSNSEITTEEIKPIKINPVISKTPDTGFSGKYLVVNVGGINYKLALLTDS